GGGRGTDIPLAERQEQWLEEARMELQFNALLLAPHQVEVLFVLCTLVGGRRKPGAQAALANLGLIEVLDSMFDRLSWGSPRSAGPNPLERIHGPGCECNPESALRVQYLRLVHNFCDRDSNNNPLKHLLLSEYERSLFAEGHFMTDSLGTVVYLKRGAHPSTAQSPSQWRGAPPKVLSEDSQSESGTRGGASEANSRAGGRGGGGGGKERRGLLSKIVDVLMQEPTDSLYRFWLASCVEAFLRGGSAQEQLFVAGSGLLTHLVREVTSDGLQCPGALQTAFDLLGELCKGNREVLEMLESSMSKAQLRRFLKVVVSNLVDSNVFIRSLVLSVEHISSQAGKRRRRRRLVPSSDHASGPRLAKGMTKGTERTCTIYQGTANWTGSSPVTMGNPGDFQSLEEGEEACYLGHTWFDIPTYEILEDSEEEEEEIGLLSGSGLVAPSGNESLERRQTWGLGGMETKGAGVGEEGGGGADLGVGTVNTVERWNHSVVSRQSGNVLGASGSCHSCITGSELDHWEREMTKRVLDESGKGDWRHFMEGE
ncbi:unnamed protein product, partial [Choristocarpus tenellus]